MHSTNTNGIIVDPDDPVAVAKQKERHMLLDQYVLSFSYLGINHR